MGASPWQIIGNTGGVTMAKENAFVGSHSPRVSAGTGIRQRDLGLVAGKGYTGYVWAKPLAGSAEVEVTLAWGEGDANRVSSRIKFSGGKYSKKTFAITSKAATDHGVLAIRVLKGDVLLGRLRSCRLTMSGACGPTRSRCSSNSTAQSTAGRVETSPAAMTGATALAIVTAARPARTLRGRPGYQQQGTRPQPGEIRQGLLASHARKLRRPHVDTLGAFLSRARAVEQR